MMLVLLYRSCFIKNFEIGIANFLIEDCKWSEFGANLLNASDFPPSMLLNGRAKYWPLDVFLVLIVILF